MGACERERTKLIGKVYRAYIWKSPERIYIFSWTDTFILNRNKNPIEADARRMKLKAMTNLSEVVFPPISLPPRLLVDTKARQSRDNRPQKENSLIHVHCSRERRRKCDSWQLGPPFSSHSLISLECWTIIPQILSQFEETLKLTLFFVSLIDTYLFRSNV